MAYTVELIRSRRRTMALQLKADGTVVVRAPIWVGTAQARRFVEEHRDWIEKQLEKRASAPQAEPLSETELKALKKQAREDLSRRAEHFAPLLGVRYERISIRCQRTKWGSCSSRGNLNFNCLLMLAPEAVRDYVVVHELCHRLEMNHSPRFWALVECVLPEYRESRAWLRKNGDALMARAPDR